MSNQSNSALNLLSDMDHCISIRTAEVRRQVERLERTKRVLRWYQQEQDRYVKMEAELVSEGNLNEKDHTYDSAADSSSQPINELDSILSLAKEIRTRATNNKPRSKRNHDLKGTASKQVKPLSDYYKETSKKTVNPEASSTVKSNVSAGKSATPAVVPTSIESAVKFQQVDSSNRLLDVLLQIKFLSRYRLPKALPSIFSSKLKYCEEAKFLSKLHRRPFHPDSVIYQVVKQRRALTGGNHTVDVKDAPSLASGGSQTSIVWKLVSSFRNLINTYEQTLRRRLEGLGTNVTQLSPDDKILLVELWYKGRRLLELYKHYMMRKIKLLGDLRRGAPNSSSAGGDSGTGSSGSSSKCLCEDCASSRMNSQPISKVIADTLHASTPLYTPLSTPRAKASNGVNLKFGSKHQKESSSSRSINNNNDDESERTLHAFHDLFKAKVEVAVESAVGQNYLKLVIQSLRACSESQMNATKLSGANSVETTQQQWIQPLKMYRAAYAVLLNEAKLTTSCIFLNK